MSRKIAALLLLVPVVLTLVSCETHEKKVYREKRVEQYDEPSQDDD